jgi:16S rRNA (uracil1498-N3)-methyltransferase
MHTKAHEFALFSEILPSKTDLVIIDKALHHRITQVLRLNVNDLFVVFNKQQHQQLRIIAITKNSLTVALLADQKNILYTPSVTLLLPILKREALEEALYAATELGATNVILVNTTKVQRHWQDRELERLERVCIAAAEQSKNYAFPTISVPVNLSAALAKLPATAQRIIFTPTGSPILEMLNEQQDVHDFVLMVGPEGDLTADEYQLLKQHAFNACALTPTVLRAQQAMTIGLGIVRSKKFSYIPKI